MITFVSHFFVCNIIIAIVILIILALKQLLKNHLSPRLQYNLWFIMLLLLVVPFLPIRSDSLYTLFSPLFSHKFSSVTSNAVNENIHTAYSSTTNLLNDFSVSVDQLSSSILFYILGIIWIAGIFVMLFLTLRSRFHLYRIERASLPLENKKAYELFEKCREEMRIKRTIPISSTIHLKSPAFIGIFHPRIYIPMQLISDFHEKDMRYIFLHELQHYKHFDSLVNCAINFYRIIYWFNPFIWYAIKEIRNDREIACDFSVLQILDKKEFVAYGNTLINFAERISFSPFASGIGGNIKQLRKRIIYIASYQPQSSAKKIRGRVLYCCIAVLVFAFTPVLSAFASTSEYYHFNPGNERVAYIDLNSFFGNYDGSFVLYDTKTGTWQICNKTFAAKRISPDSTYKIYDALIGLESGVITPSHSEMKWDGSNYSFTAWNTDQNLNTAIQNSVNWYFQAIDKQVGLSTVRNYIEKFHYGNQNISGKFPSYWLESSLKISPIEQVELLRKFYYNDFGFHSQNIDAVKNALRISSSSNGAIYGKTGTGQVNHQDINGWFVGYVEISSHTYFFATNIQSDKNATGKTASEITLSILSDMKIWN